MPASPPASRRGSAGPGIGSTVTGALEAGERTVEIRRDHVPPLPERHLQRECGRAGPGVVDEHVHAAEPAGQLVNDITAACDVGGVQAADFCLGSSPPDLSGGVMRPFLVGMPRDAHVHPRTGQRDRYGAADP
jgi:hypothetical protein